jgi:hypothetical protein
MESPTISGRRSAYGGIVYKIGIGKGNYTGRIGLYRTPSPHCGIVRKCAIRNH